MADKGKEKSEKARRGANLVNVRKCCGCNREFLPAVHPDDQHVIVRADSD